MANGTDTILDGCLRLTVGSTKQMDLLFRDLLEVMSVDSPKDKST